jgi:hypothetical protein
VTWIDRGKNGCWLPVRMSVFMTSAEHGDLMCLKSSDRSCGYTSLLESLVLYGSASRCLSCVCL